MWKGLREIFTYNKKQRNGLLILLGIAILLQCFLYFDELFFELPEQDFTEFKEYVARLKREDSIARYEKSIPPELFSFDPNTASAKDLSKLGLSEREISTLINYRNKGGFFRRPEDVQKIYGLDSSWLQSAMPFMEIASVEDKEWKRKNHFNFSKFDINKVSREQMMVMGLREWQAERIITYRKKVRPFQQAEELYKVYGMDSSVVTKMLPFVNIDSADLKLPEPEEIVIVELNSADSILLLKLPGIGPSYAGRIMEYRIKMGGFYKKSQLLEVYGMDKERFDRIKDQVRIDRSKIKKLDVNKATFKELLRHPYLEYEVVVNIANFREHIRPFKEVEELKNIELINEVLFSKIANYLTVTTSSTKSDE